jgi:hypothetical protein
VDITVTDSLFDGCYSDYDSGGSIGLYLLGSTATIQQSTFQNGYAAYLGGAIHSTNYDGLSTLIVMDCNFTSSYAYYGGAISNLYEMTTNVWNSSFGHLKAYLGAATFFSMGNLVNINDCDFYQSYADIALVYFYMSNDNVYVGNSYFHQNLAFEILVYSSSHDGILENLLFTDTVTTDVIR